MQNPTVVLAVAAVAVAAVAALIDMCRIKISDILPPPLRWWEYVTKDTNYSMVEAALYEISPKTKNLRNELKSFTVSDYRREFQNDYNIFSFCMPQLTNSMPIASWQDLIATYQTNPFVVLYYYNNHYRPYSHVSDSITQLARDKYFKIHENRNKKKNLYTNY